VSKQTPYFVLHGQPGSIYVTFHSGNGERVWWTEGYSRRRTAYAAIALFCGPKGNLGWTFAYGGTRAVRANHPGYDDELPIRDEVAKRRTKPTQPLNINSGGVLTTGDMS
jgi:uncharacterized protein YegP (UPF0339 family)